MFNLNNTIHYFLVQAEQICVGVSVTVRNGIHLHQLQPQTHETASYQKGGMMMYAKRLVAGRFKLLKYDSGSNSYSME
jgi:hypothetical protein